MADFLDYLPLELILVILALLDDPLDVIRLSLVSPAYYLFAVKNCIAKIECLRRTPMLADINNVNQLDGMLGLVSIFHLLQNEHNMYASILLALSKAGIAPMDCTEYVIGASSTDKYPGHSIVNVLLPAEMYNWGNSYWSSRGHPDADVSENIIFRLNGGVCIVTEIDIRPYLARLPYGDLIFSARSIRFRMGCARSPAYVVLNEDNLPLPSVNQENFIWGYSSPEFPMAQEHELQRFRLHKPVLCMGGFLMIELLGMAQKEFGRNLYYCNIGYVRILGHSLRPAYDTITGAGGAMTLTYRPSAVPSVLRQIQEPLTAIPMMPGEHLLWMFHNVATQAAQVRNMMMHKMLAGEEEGNDGD